MEVGDAVTGTGAGQQVERGVLAVDREDVAHEVAGAWVELRRERGMDPVEAEAFVHRRHSGRAAAADTITKDLGDTFAEEGMGAADGKRHDGMGGLVEVRNDCGENLAIAIAPGELGRAEVGEGVAVKEQAVIGELAPRFGLAEDVLREVHEGLLIIERPST